MPVGRASGSPTPSPETGGLEGSAGRRAGGRRGPRRGFAGASPTPGAFEHLVLCSPATRVPCWGTFPRFFTSRGLFSDCRVRVPYTVQIQDFRQKRTLRRFSPSPWFAFHSLHSVFWKKKRLFNFEKIRFSVCSSRFIRLPSLLSNLCPITQIFALIFLLEVF